MRRSHLLRMAVGLLWGCCVAWTVCAGPVVLRDDRGVSLSWTSAPQRIVSLLPSLTESVCALDACNRLVATDRYSNWPAHVTALPKVGGLDDTQVERIAVLRPDVVLVDSSVRVIERLQALGMKVVVLDVKSHADVHRALQLLARLLEAPGAADAVWSAVQADLTRAAAAMPATVRGQRAYFQIDPTPYAAGVDSFVGETMSRLGLRNVVSSEWGAFPRLNPEFVVRSQPDVVIASRADLRDMPGRPGWAAMTALREHRYCAFEPAQLDLLVRPGPRLGEGALMLSRCLAGLNFSRS